MSTSTMDPLVGRFTVNKLEVVKRQLLTAIELYKNDKDPVSTHTLAAAAYNVLKDLNPGNLEFIKDYFTEHIKPGMEKEAHRLLYQAENFFKHANKDPEGELEIHPELATVFLWEACGAYRKLSDDHPPEMVAYNIWFKVQHPNFLVLNEVEKFRSDFSRVLSERMGKKKFMELVALLANQKSHSEMSR